MNSDRCLQITQCFLLQLFSEYIQLFLTVYVLQWFSGCVLYYFTQPFVLQSDIYSAADEVNPQLFYTYTDEAHWLLWPGAVLPGLISPAHGV